MDSSSQMDSSIQRNQFRIVMVPWLAYSHTNCFLELAKRLTTHNFYIYVCSTKIMINNIKKKLDQKYAQSIEFVELILPPSSDLPPHYHTTFSLPPHLHKTLHDSYEKCAPDFTTLLQNHRPNLFIYDFCQWWAAHAALSFNIPSVQFLTASPVGLSTAFHSITKSSSQQYPFPEIYLKDHETTVAKETFNHDVNAKDPYFEYLRRSYGPSNIILFKTIREIDWKYIDYTSETIEKKVLHIGPLIQESSKDDDHEHMDVFQFLEKKKDNSVVYISFGSEYYLSHNEIQDIANALELSNVSFIWVIRFPEGNKTSIEQVLPDGFLEKLGDKGMVMENWALQTKILNHSSTGGFVNHGGWNSVLESILYGVPIITMPMQYDQPYVARLLEDIGIGIDVGRNGDGRWKTEEMSNAIKKVLEEDDGKIREKVVKLGEIMKEKGDRDFDNMAIDLIKICEAKN